MKTNSARLRWACLLLAVLFTAAALTACNGSEEVSEESAPAVTAPTQTNAPTQTAEPTQTPEPTQAPTQEPEATQTPEPTQTLEPTPAPAATNTPLPAPENRQMSLDEYAAFCAEFDSTETEEEEGEITYGEFSDSLGVLIGLLESVNPPAEVSDWNQAQLTNTRELKAEIDEYPGSTNDPIDIEKFFSLILSYHESLGGTVRAMDPAIRDWLITAKCMDEEMASLYLAG